MYAYCKHIFLEVVREASCYFNIAVKMKLNEKLQRIWKNEVAMHWCVTKRPRINISWPKILFGGRKSMELIPKPSKHKTCCQSLGAFFSVVNWNII